MRRILDDFVEQLRLKLGGNLKSAVLYGSAVSGEHINRRSDINVLLILNSADLKSLRAVADVRRRIRFNKINPLVFTEGHLNTSSDTFPMEFLDIKEKYTLLFGKDYLVDLKVGLSNLRHQCEWELKSKIIQMQKFYMNSGARGAALMAFLLKCLPSFLAIFKNILRLKNIAADDRADILSKIAAEFNLDIDLLNYLWQARLGNFKIADAHRSFEKFLSELSRLSDAVDKISMACSRH